MREDDDIVPILARRRRVEISRVDPEAKSIPPDPAMRFARFDAVGSEAQIPRRDQVASHAAADVQQPDQAFPLAGALVCSGQAEENRLLRVQVEEAAQLLLRKFAQLHAGIIGYRQVPIFRFREDFPDSSAAWAAAEKKLVDRESAADGSAADAAGSLLLYSHLPKSGSGPGMPRWMPHRTQ